MLIKSRAACAAWLFLYSPANTKFIHLHLYRRYSKCYNKQWEDDYHMTFSNTLKQARESLGMTQMELSRALGVSFSTINRYENGKHRPTPIVMKAIQNLFASEGIPFVLDSDMEGDTEHGREDKQD